MMGVKKIRYWLVDIRKSRNLTQEEVAKKAKIARTTYAMIEQDNRNPSVSVAKRIADVLEFPWTYFFDDRVHETRNKTYQKTSTA